MNAVSKGLLGKKCYPEKEMSFYYFGWMPGWKQSLVESYHGAKVILFSGRLVALVLLI